MNNLKLVETDIFNEIATCDFWGNANNEYLVTREQIGRALGYSNPANAIKNIHLKHKERLDKFSTQLTSKQIEGNRQIERKRTFYNLQGVLLIIQYSQVPEQLKENLLTKIKSKMGNKEIVVITERKELNFINDMEEILSVFLIKGIRQFRIGNKYRIDYYIPTIKVAIEYDENSHKLYNKDEEIMRETFIKEQLGCKFIRISDDYNNNKGIGLVIKKLINWGILKSGLEVMNNA